jgi:hypothetical protein
MRGLAHLYAFCQLWRVGVTSRLCSWTKGDWADQHRRTGSCDLNRTTLGPPYVSDEAPEWRFGTPDGFDPHRDGIDASVLRVLSLMVSGVASSCWN